jgi:hypothetical protein
MYTSGRTVKSRNAKPTTLAAATRDARNLVHRLDMVALYGLVTIATTRTADPVTLDARLRTVITFPSNTDADALATALTALPGYVSMLRDACSITIIRAA